MAKAIKGLEHKTLLHSYIHSQKKNIMIGVNASVNRIIAIAKPSACSANEILGWLIHWWSTLMFSPALN
jgi:hypothetical protein